MDDFVVSGILIQLCKLKYVENLFNNDGCQYYNQHSFNQFKKMCSTF